MFYTGAALALLAFTACPETDEADATENGTEIEYDFRFGVISDTHIGANQYNGSDTYPLPGRLNKALDWYNTQTGVRAIAIVGDITDYGRASEWETVKASLKDHLGRLKLIAVMGNHDAYGTINTAADLFEDGTGQKTNAHYEMSGYHFIVINAGSGAFTSQGTTGSTQRFPIHATGRTATPGATGNTGDVVPASVKDWLRGRIDFAKEKSPGKPIFVFLHWPIKNTFYISDEWYTSSFGDSSANYFFNTDPEVIVFGGHIHSPNNDPRSIWQDKFTTVNTVTLHYMEMEKGGATAKYLGHSSNGITPSTGPKHPVMRGGGYGNGPRAQGMIVSVKGSAVTIENFDFDVSDGPTPLENVVPIPQVWKFDVSKPESFPYTWAVRNTQKTAPVFPANAAIRITNTSATTVTIDFDQAKIPAPNHGNEVVHSYQFDFLVSGNVVKTAYQWSDFMDTPRLQKPTYSQLIGGLTANTAYELRIYAFSSFQAKSAAYISKTFTTTP